MTQTQCINYPIQLRLFDEINEFACRQYSISSDACSLITNLNLLEIYQTSQNIKNQVRFLSDNSDNILFIVHEKNKDDRKNKMEIMQKKIKSTLNEIISTYRNIKKIICTSYWNMLYPHEKILCHDILTILFTELIYIMQTNFIFRYKKLIYEFLDKPSLTINENNPLINQNNPLINQNNLLINQNNPSTTMTRLKIPFDSKKVTKLVREQLTAQDVLVNHWNRREELCVEELTNDCMCIDYKAFYNEYICGKTLPKKEIFKWNQSNAMSHSIVELDDKKYKVFFRKFNPRYVASVENHEKIMYKIWIYRICEINDGENHVISFIWCEKGYSKS